MDLHENPQNSGMKKRKPEQVPPYNNSPKKDSFFFSYFLFVWNLVQSFVSVMFVLIRLRVKFCFFMGFMIFFLDRWNFINSRFFVFLLMKYVFLYPLFLFVFSWFDFLLFYVSRYGSSGVLKQLKHGR